MLFLKNTFSLLQIAIFACLLHPMICESNESNTVTDEVTEGENVELSTSPVSETEQVLTEAENVADLTEPLSSTPSLVTEKSVVAKASTHTTPIKIVTEISIETPPENMIAVWDDEGKICLLAKFSAIFSISYAGNGQEQDIIVDLPSFAKAKGKCESSTESPLLQLLWDGFDFTITFSKQSNDKDESSWVASSFELRYDTSMPIFDGATNAGKKMARSKPLQLFETEVGKSYSCPSPEVILLYSANKQVATLRLKNVRLQPFEVKDAKMSPAHRCGQVALDSPDDEQFVQDETVPLAVGCTLGLLTLFVLVGFSIYRAYTAAKVDYSNMEE